MTFGEKLCKLRKEKGLSQELLAEQLGTSRQAISKWENHQGFPEIEKLLQLSDLFGVSTDYLLKNESTHKAEDKPGYYISREMAAGYLANQKKVSCCIGIIAISLTMQEIFIWSKYHAFIFLAFAAGLFGFCYCAGVIDAYELLVNNEEHVNKFRFKIKRKIREKIAQW